MAKSLRSKIKRRYRKVKRQFVDETVVKDRVNEAYNKVQQLRQGIRVDVPRPKNAFLYPNDPEAVFPKTQLRQPLDFRSEALPLSGYAASGCRRKYNDEEKLRLNLVLRSMDGCPDLEKRQLMEEQQRSYDLMPLEDVYAGEMLATEENPVTFEDETALISSIGNIGLSAVSESQTRGSDLEYLKAHQQRVGGRAKGSHHEKPVVKNFLKTRKGGKS